MTVRVAEPASRGVPLSVAVTTSLSANIYIYIYCKCSCLYSHAILWGLDVRNDSLGFCPDLSVHDGSGGDAASQWVNLKQAAHGR